jgi:hypothetical protein
LRKAPIRFATPAQGIICGKYSTFVYLSLLASIALPIARLNSLSFPPQRELLSEHNLWRDMIIYYIFVVAV